MNISIVRCKIDGLYVLGEGWVHGRAEWDEWLGSMSDCRIQKIPPPSSYDCWRLTTVYSSVYLHPMGGLFVLRGEDEVAMVREHITNLVEYCGGSVAFAVQNEVIPVEV